MTKTQLKKAAYRDARQAGLDANTADAVARRVVEAVESADLDIGDMLPGDCAGIIRAEVQRHANP